MNIQELIKSRYSLEQVNQWIIEKVIPEVYESFDDADFDPNDADENYATFTEDFANRIDTLVSDIFNNKDMNEISMDELNAAIGFLSFLKHEIESESGKIMTQAEKSNFSLKNNHL